MAGFSVVKRGIDAKRDGRGPTAVSSTTALNPVTGIIPVVNATDPAYGAKADAQQSTGTITSGQNTVTISAGSVPAVGQFVMIPGAGPLTSGVGGPFTAYVSSVASNVATLVTTKGGSTPATASATSASAPVTFGTGCASAVNTALAVGKRVHLPAGSYIWDSAINPSTLYLTGDGIGRTIIYFPSSLILITVTGTGLVGSTGALTANAAAGVQSLTVGGGVPAGISPGDFILLSSTTVFDATEAFCTLGEFCRVYGISGTTVYLNSPLVGPFTYLTSATAKIQKVSFLEGVHVSDIEWINGTPEKFTAGPATPATPVWNAGGGSILRIKKTAWATVENMKATGWAGDFINFTNCVHFRAQNIDARDGAHAPTASAGQAYGYAISGYGSQWGEVTGGSIEMCHGYFNAEGTGQVGGDIVLPSSTIEVRGATSRNGIGEPFLAHNASAYIDYIDCKVYGGPLFPTENTHGSGFQISGYYCRVIDPIITNATGQPIILLNDHCEAIRPVIRNVWPWNDRCDAIVVVGTNCKVIGADIDTVANDPGTSTTGRGIYVQSTASGCEIRRSVIRNTQRHGIDIQNSNAAQQPIIDDLTGVNIGLSGTGALISSIATLIPANQWTNVRGTNLASGISNKPAVAATSNDRESALRRGTILCLRESVDRREGGQVALTATSGTIFAGIVPVLAGDTFTKILFRTTATAATFGSNNDGHWYVAVWDNSAGALIGQSADQGIAAIGANLIFDIALSSYSPAADALVRVGIMVYLGTGGAPVAPTIGSATPMLGGGAAITGLAAQGISGTTGNTTGVAPAFGTVANLSVGPYFALHN